MEKQLSNLIKCSDADASYLLGLFYGKIKLSKRLSTFYGDITTLNKIKSLISLYISRESNNYVIFESYKLSNVLSNIIPLIVKQWKYHSPCFKEHFLRGYYESNIREIKLGNSLFYYIKGKKRILKEYKTEVSFIVKFSTDYILYIPNTCSVKNIVEFDSLFNISKKDQYKAIIGLIIGDAHVKKYNYLQITHTDKQLDYILFLKKVFDYWGFESTVGSPSNTGRKRKDGSYIINHYYYIKLDNCDYFKNRIDLKNKQVNSYLASRLTAMSLLFWYLDDGSYTKYGCNLHTNCFDILSQNILIKYLKSKFNILAKKYKNKKGHTYLHLSVEDSSKLLSTIECYKKYLPNCFGNKFESFNNTLCMI